MYLGLSGLHQTALVCLFVPLKDYIFHNERSGWTTFQLSNSCLTKGGFDNQGHFPQDQYVHFNWSHSETVISQSLLRVSSGIFVSQYVGVLLFCFKQLDNIFFTLLFGMCTFKQASTSDCCHLIILAGAIHVTKAKSGAKTIKACAFCHRSQ